MFVVQGWGWNVNREFHDFASALASLKTEGDCAKVFRVGCVETITVHCWGKTVLISDCIDCCEFWMTEEIVQTMCDFLNVEYLGVNGTFLRRFPRIPSSVRILAVESPEPSFQLMVSHALYGLEIYNTKSPLTSSKIQTLRQFARRVQIDHDVNKSCEGRVMDVSDDTDVAKCLSAY